MSFLKFQESDENMLKSKKKKVQLALVICIFDYLQGQIG